MKIKNKILVILTSILLFMVPCFVWAIEEPEPSPSVSPDPSETSSPPSQSPEPEISSSITLNQTEVNLNAGESITLVAKVEPEDSNVIWSSNDEFIATVDSNGKVTAGNKAGTATITATIEVEGTKKTATCTVKVTRSIGKDATLKSLKIKNGTLNENFDPNVFEYTVNINTNISEIVIDYERSDQNATAFVTNNSNLKNGSIVELKVVAEDKETNHIYKLKIVKDEVKATSLNLKSLEINGYALNETFKANTTKYTANIPYEIDTITVEASPEDSDAKVTISGTSKLKVGNNTVSIVVKDSKGNSKTYQIEVTREEEASVTEKPTSIITSSDANASGVMANNNHSNSDKNQSDSFLKYLIVSLACLILFIIGGIGIYFYMKTSPKRLRKELSKYSNDNSEESFEDDENEIESPIIETSSFPHELPKEQPDYNLEKTKELKKEELLEMLFNDEEDV